MRESNPPKVIANHLRPALVHDSPFFNLAVGWRSHDLHEVRFYRPSCLPGASSLIFQHSVGAARVKGFEPLSTVLETGVLPLHHTRSGGEIGPRVRISGFSDQRSYRFKL